MGQAQTKNAKKKGEDRKFESKDEYFIKNGAILLEKQIALSQGREVTGQLKILSQTEIKNATNNYDPNRVSLRLQQANIYKVILDERLVLIKTPIDVNPNHELIDLFLTDAAIAFAIRHDHMNKIYGCCLETRVPMIVYHCGSVSQYLRLYLHDDLALKKVFKWRGRLKVATDIAYTLSYMHNALFKPVVHRDVKSSSILIDSSFHAILVNVSYSVSITPGKRWPVHGTPGYIDPEYMETGEVSDKCDVYSFGVLMLELLTVMDPFEMAKCGRNLADEFVLDVGKNGCINDMIDKIVMEEGDMTEIERFARLALKCVAKKGEERPNMILVVEELWEIQDYHNDFYHGKMR